MREDERVGQTPGLLEDRAGRADRTALVEGHERDHRLAAAMVEILDEQVHAAVVQEWKRIGIAAKAGIGQDVPGYSRERARVPQVGSIDAAPTRAPMGSMAAQVIEPPDERPREALRLEGRHVAQPCRSRGSPLD